MHTEAIKCPACGAPLQLSGAEECVCCAYCRNTIRVQRRSVNDDGSVTVKDKATGMTICRVHIPIGFETVGMLLPEVSSYAYPFGVSVGACNDGGAVISYFVGEGYCDRSKCPMLSGMYSQGLDRISRTHYRNFQDIRQYADAYAAMYANTARASDIVFLDERAMPLYEPFDDQAALDSYKRRISFEKQRSGAGNMAKDLGYYTKGVCRVYEMTVAKERHRVALVTVLKAWKYQFSGGIGGGIGSIGEIGDRLNNIFGGSVRDAVKDPFGGTNPKLTKALFGNSLIGRAIERNAQPQQQTAPQQAASQTAAPKAASFGDMPHNAAIDWQSDGVFILQCPPDAFEEAFANPFTDFCSTFELDDGIKEKMFNMQNDILHDIERHTQQRLDQMNRQFQSWQQVHATQQAAFDSYNRAWWNRTNSADAARRSAYRAGMAADDRMSERYSEAIRGVNTYVRDDGTEVEVSVDHNRAYTNYSGDTLGSNSAFEPGGNWREMRKK